MTYFFRWQKSNNEVRLKDMDQIVFQYNKAKTEMTGIFLVMYCIYNNSVPISKHFHSSCVI